MNPNPYPWYDSRWLATFSAARALVAARHPDRAADFEAAFEGLRTHLEFRTIELKRVLDARALEACRSQIRAIEEDDLDKREFFRFGRLIRQDLPFFVEMQTEMTDLVSELVGEPVEPGYNFVSLYNNLGVCELHLDAPSAKWTVDVCIEQSADWPLYISDALPWPLSPPDPPAR